jgi:hypothetical protein
LNQDIENSPKSGAFQAQTVLVIGTLALTVVSTVVFLSNTSLYWISAVSGVSREIATMLTPWGLIKNRLLQTSYVLSPLYDEPADRLGLFQDPSIRAGVALTVGSSIALLAIAYRRISRDPNYAAPEPAPRERRDFRNMHDFANGDTASDRSQDNES